MRVLTTLFTVFFTLGFVGDCVARAPEWLVKMREVKLLQHSYQDVISILGIPSDASSEPELSEYFDAHNGRYFVAFASGLCVTTDYSDGKPMGWKVPMYTATSISFTPKKKIKADEGLRLDLSLGSTKYKMCPGRLFTRTAKPG